MIYSYLLITELSYIPEIDENYYWWSKEQHNAFE